jgi:plastocyanin
VAAPQEASNATLNLEPGNYLWICLFNLPDGIPHVVGHGMAEPFVVEAAGASHGSQTAPEADVVMRLVDYAFSPSTPLTTGRQMIRVENAGSESHEVSVVKLAPGKTIEDFLAWIRNPTTPSETTWTGAGGVTSLAPGAEAYFEVDLTPGEYVLLCFVTAPDGRSHIDHGMIQRISVG